MVKDWAVDFACVMGVDDYVTVERCPENRPPEVLERGSRLRDQRPPLRRSHKVEEFIPQSFSSWRFKAYIAPVQEGMPLPSIPAFRPESFISIIPYMSQER